MNRSGGSKPFAYYQEALGVAPIIASPQMRPEGNYFAEKPGKSASLQLYKGA